MRSFCTLFDSRYLPQGLVLYESLLKHSSVPFKLCILAMNDHCYDTLKHLGIPDVFRLEEVEDGNPELVAAKGNRTWQEFCWTCASSFAEEMLNYVEEITYLDADMMFFSDPEVIFHEIGDNSLAIIPHRFKEEDRERLEPNGRFNVCWNTFRGPVGRKCLSTWAAQCREWCYYRNEDGKFGDQGFLDAWPDLYGNDLHIIQNIGAGLAPWNIETYGLYKFGDGELLLAGPCAVGFGGFVPVVFFHYHEYIHGERLTNYPLRPVDRELIYIPYIEAINAAKARIGALQPA